MRKIVHRHYSIASLQTARAALIALLFLSSASRAYSADSGGVYPGRLEISKSKNLSTEERKVEERFANYLEEHTDEAVARYKAKYGKEIDTDNARELSADYAPGGPDAEDPATIRARTKWSEAVEEPSRALSKELYRRSLRSIPAPNQRKQVIFTAGGAGVGKTTSIEQVPGLARAVDAAEIIYDTTLSHVKSAMAEVEQALAAGRVVSIIYVYRDPIDAFVGGVLPRAEAMGRTLPLEAFLDTHMGAADVLEKLAAAYQGNDKVAIAVIDNSRGRGNAGPSDIGFVKVAAEKYRRDELKAKLSAALDEAYEKGKKGEKDGISEAVYRAIKRDAS
jgi:Zeta toxin